MRVIPEYQLAPGSCALTRTSTGPCVDTLIDFDDLPNHGRLYISRDAVSDMAQQFGFLPPEAADRLVCERDDARAETERLRKQMNDLEAVKAVLDGWKDDSMSKMPTPTELKRPAYQDEPVIDEPEQDGAIPEMELTDEQIAEALEHVSAGDELAEATGDDGFADPDDTPDGQPLDDDLSAILLLLPEPDEDEPAIDPAATIAAFYGPDVQSMADLIEEDPPPDLVAEIKEWIDDANDPVISLLRRHIAVAVEKDGQQRPTVLALIEED